MTENIGKFVDHHSRKVVNKIWSHVDDTGDFLRKMETFKQEQGVIADDIFPVSIDVEKLYPSIPLEEGIQFFKEALDKCNNGGPSSNFLVELLEMVMRNNLVEFNKKFYRQTYGTSMGSPCSPSYADVFMDALETRILTNMDGGLRNKIVYFCRYLDDILIFFKGKKEEFQTLMDYFNGFHESIKFTFEMDYENRTTHWLDCQITVENGTIVTDLYRKPEASIQYLLPSSCHPPHCWRNIPYSLAFRLRRICSKEETFLARLEELESMLLSREYPKRVITGAFERVKNLSRKHTLQKVANKSKKKTTFIITFDPRLPNMGQVLQKHFKTMTLDPELKEAFPEGVQVGFKRYRNIKEQLCRARLYDVIERPQRNTTIGWKKCNRCGTQILVCDLPPH